MNTYYTENQKRQAKLKREHFIKTGVEQAKQNDPLHIKGCMLYWAEGSKNSNIFGFSNCDVEAHRLMLQFLKRFFPHVMPSVKARINFYPAITNTYEDVQSFWRKELELTTEQFHNPTDRSKYYKQPKKNKYKNGICYLQLNSTEVIQHIFGAINHYVGKEIFNADSGRKQKGARS